MGPRRTGTRFCVRRNWASSSSSPRSMARKAGSSRSAACVRPSRKSKERDSVFPLLRDRPGDTGAFARAKPATEPPSERKDSSCPLSSIRSRAIRSMDLRSFSPESIYLFFTVFERNFGEKTVFCGKMQNTHHGDTEARRARRRKGGSQNSPYNAVSKRRDIEVDDETDWFCQQSKIRSAIALHGSVGHVRRSSIPK